MRSCTHCSQFAAVLREFGFTYIRAMLSFEGPVYHTVL